MNHPFNTKNIYMGSHLVSIAKGFGKKMQKTNVFLVILINFIVIIPIPKQNKQEKYAKVN